MTQRYSVRSEARGGVEIYSLSEADRAQAEVAPGLGNNCFMFRVREPVLEPVAFEEFSKRPTSYGIPILFPFPNRIRDGKFSFRGQGYTVDPPRHGFVRDKSWTVVGTGSSDQEGAWITSSLDAAQYAEKILKQFPFPFRIEVTYRLKDSRLEMETRVKNTGDHEMPLGFGIHPYFRLPEKGAVTVPANKRWELADSLPTGNQLDVKENYDLRRAKDLNGLTLDDIFSDVKPDSDGVVRCVLDDQQKGIRTFVEFDAAQFPYVVVYTPPAPRRAICIEPNTCPTDAFNLQEKGIDSNVIALDPGATLDFNVGIYTRKSGA